jgi:flagellar basal body rod protein FlgG
MFPEIIAVATDKRDMMDFSIPLAGLNRAESSLNQTAAKIARPTSSDPGDSVDLSSEMVSLIQARQGFGMNTKSLETEDDLTKSLLNLIG